MENSDVSAAPSRGSLRWAILRRAVNILPLPSLDDHSVDVVTKDTSRKRSCGFKLIPCCNFIVDLVDECQSVEITCQSGPNEISVCYKLPIAGDPKLVIIQRSEDCVDLDDFRFSNGHDIDTTGLVCCWPSEDVLAYFCINRCEVFRSKRVLELGSGYGLAGLAVAVCTEALEVVISDGNPQVVDYVQRSINMNSSTFGDTEVKSMELHWNQEHKHEMLNYFDIIIASDCTFFKDFHGCLAQTIKSLLKNSERSEAIFLSPKRGDSLSRFLAKIKDLGLCYELLENYDSKVWSLHQKFLHGDDISWPNYDADHCYPLLVRITFQESKISHTEN